MQAVAGVRLERLGLRRERLIAVGLLLLYVLLYVLPLGVRPLDSPDEVRYGAIAHEMLTSGDWISPHFNGVRYFEKPVLGYWLNSASLAVLGETPFALRLPEALATGFTALIVLGLARRFLTAFAAWLAAGIFLTTFLVAGVGTFAVLDAYLALFLTAALASFYLAIATGQPRRRRACLALCGAACGAAFLVKGFLALAIPVVVAAPYLIARRRWRTLLTSPWLPLAVAAAIVLPWAVAIQLREPDFWRYFFWVEHIQRFAGGDAQHAQPFWYYLPWLPLAGWPWILLLPAALIGLTRATAAGGGMGAGKGGGAAAGSGLAHGGGKIAVAPADTAKNSRDAAFLWYTAAWAGLPLLFLSLSKGKLPTYILPCFAPLAILLAAGLERYLAAARQGAFRLAAGVLALVFVALIAGLLAAQAGAFGPPPFAPGELVKLLAFAFFMACGAGCSVFALGNAPRVPKLAAVAGAGAALFLPLQLTLPQSVLENISPGIAISRYGAASADTLVVSDAPLFGTVAWALKRDDIYVLSPGEIEYGLSYPESRYRQLGNSGLEQLIDANRGRHAILIVCEASTDERITGLMPADARRSQHGEVVLWRIPARDPAGHSSGPGPASRARPAQ
ncbi:MAG TPA: phospholipid carrier-dependent glycosyltransferase [Gammaproteobacteria bacterium]|nr:phospholipid carrier-dependent glycosyltransferase [Gammaproteobacteria bacterium]